MQFQSTPEVKRLARSLTRALSTKFPEFQLSDAQEALAAARGYSSWNALVVADTPQAVDRLLSAGERNHMHDAQSADLTAEETGMQGYGNETVVRAHTGFQLRCPAYPEECSYLRVCDPLGREIAYWVFTEWQDAPQDVIGAVIGALVRGETFQETQPKRASAPRIQDVAFNLVSEVVYGDQCLSVAWREDSVLARLASPAGDEDSEEDVALTLHRNDEGLIFEEELTLSQLRALQWNDELRGFRAPDGTQFRPFYSLDFANVVGA